MSAIKGYEPADVLKFFEEICSIPHGSGNIEKISDYLVSFAKERGLYYRQDESKNVVIKKEGSAGYEKSAPVIIQGHMDMVAVKVDSCTKDLEKEGLDLEVVNGDLLCAKGTSLGGDDGIAVAYALALLDSDTIPHPPLEVVVTVDEEIGMIGASAMDVSDLEGKIFLNIDSEDEGVFTVSCAGGLSAICHIPYETEDESGTLLTLKLTGFKGGHSGVEINKGRLNSNLVLGRLLYAVKNDLRIVSVSGGEKDNAISKISEAVILVQGDNTSQIKEKIMKEFRAVKAEYASVETDLHLEMSQIPHATIRCMTAESSYKTIVALTNFPNGIQRMNPDMKDMVQTSLNLGILKMNDDEIIITSALRSSVESEKVDLFHKVEAFVSLLGGTVEIQGDYPGWAYRPESRLRDTMVEVYRLQYGQEPVVEGIHAGLECGIFASKIDDLDCISFGPQMKDIHTTNEVLSIASTARTWTLLKSTLAELK